MTGCAFAGYLMMPPGTRDLLKWMSDRERAVRARLQRRASYGGRKGRAAARRLRRMGVELWGEPERVIAQLYGPLFARPPYGVARPGDEP